jgi:hypothetical protein
MFVTFSWRSIRGTHGALRRACSLERLMVRVVVRLSLSLSLSVRVSGVIMALVSFSVFIYVLPSF